MPSPGRNWAGADHPQPFSARFASVFQFFVASLWENPECRPGELGSGLEGCRHAQMTKQGQAPLTDSIWHYFAWWHLAFLIRTSMIARRIFVCSVCMPISDLSCHCWSLILMCLISVLPSGVTLSTIHRRCFILTAYFSYPSLIQRPRSRCSLWNFAMKLTIGKLESWGSPPVKTAWS